MAHKYVKEIVDLKNTPYGWSENTGRDSKWLEERRIYGFDERETWSLDTTFFYWLYERLMMFKKVNCINLDFHKFKIKGVELTQRECIDKMICNCKKIATYQGVDDLSAMKNETLDIWKECIFSMWW
ncbi:hypothetical protein [Clostridium botulinum]|uniref:hypothetical protein n=1 Tax=Clostridium botulinum TaxID=1491 RepID=UPI0013759811|nr:hypothetical protein [Clostridium botulinum]MBY6842894.1 hypothetical protein [Clostridium botulinum]MBY6844630.1 hypothetical protein [Clostridium botulinum]MCR1176436.1 hypothetical protein [Clostridium botulinum]NCI19830.1 hypothetical protein [Clostridium botulinum]NCI35868.1 hypothetical protein [Clostridium botulinum]